MYWTPWKTKGNAGMPPINSITREDITKYAGYGNMNLYQHIAGKSAIYPGKGTQTGIMYCALKLNGEAGEFAEHVGKAMRDDSWGQLVPTDSGNGFERRGLTSERRDALIKELGDCLWYIAALSSELDMSLELVALANLNKLHDRSNRNALQGAGDSR